MLKIEQHSFGIHVLERVDDQAALQSCKIATDDTYVSAIFIAFVPVVFSTVNDKSLLIKISSVGYIVDVL